MDALGHRVVINSVADFHRLVVHINCVTRHLHACVESSNIVPEMPLQQVCAVDGRVSDVPVRLHLRDALVVVGHAFNSGSFLLVSLGHVVLSHLQLTTLEVGVSLKEVDALALLVVSTGQLLGTLLVVGVHHDWLVLLSLVVGVAVERDALVWLQDTLLLVVEL